MQYRNDIAGLRAVAVLPILLVHAGIEAIPGGFIGVDIFFVISGCLITSIIVREMEQDRFTLLGFYRRRAVRILPALLTMLLVTLAAAALLLFPDDLANLGWSTASASLSVSNLWFWRNVSYFGTRAELEPLLHTWSLGVEEQFYLLYPVFLIVVRRFAPARLKPALWVVLLASLVVGWAQFPSGAFAFYMLPSRAWELALGGLVALGGFPVVRSAAARGALAGLGLALIGAGLFVITPEMAFPVPWALLPCIGTALLIAYGETGGTAWLLSLAPMRFVGDISYSLYLWHWPVMSLWRFQRGVVLAPWEMAATIALSFALAVASYRWIERPFLARHRDTAAGRVVAVAAIAMLAVAFVALAVARFAPAIRPVDPRVAGIMETAGYPQSETMRGQFGVGRCHVTVESPAFRTDACLSPAPDRPNILLLGDSHAAHLSQALRERLGDGAHLLQATASGCRPILPYAGDARCTRVMRLAVDGPLRGAAVGRVVIAAHWRAEEFGGVRTMVAELRRRGVAVTVLGPVMRYEEDMPRVLARAVANDDPAMIARNGDATRASLDATMRRTLAGTGAHYVSMIDLECPRGACPALAPDGRPFHFDTTHFTLSASREIVGRLPAAALAAEQRD